MTNKTIIYDQLNTNVDFYQYLDLKISTKNLYLDLGKKRKREHSATD